MEKIWPRFKVMFALAHKDLQRHQTVAQQGYSMENKGNMMEVLKIIGQLAEATQADWKAVANLTQSNVVLFEELEMTH